MSQEEWTERLRDLVKSMEEALGEENVVTLETYNILADRLIQSGELMGLIGGRSRLEEAIKLYEKVYVGHLKRFGEDCRDTLQSVNNLGACLLKMGKYEQALGVPGARFGRDREDVGYDSS
ncbi:hypothetical protein TrLO_g4806 [Triparma laevis f. longispina]|nr:hypothetical protein TrLO_g4806 [Triparma laevis f. longispina]